MTLVKKIVWLLLSAVPILALTGVICVAQRRIDYLNSFAQSNFAISDLLEKSEIVCKVKILSDNEEPFIISDWWNCCVAHHAAHVQTLSLIKGHVPNQFVIKYPAGARQTRTKVLNGDIVIVFLKKDQDGYRYYDDRHGRLKVIEQKILYSFGDSPHDRLFAEVMTLVKEAKGDQLKQAIEELGNLQDPRALDILRSFSSGNIEIASKAFAARIELKDFPEAEEMSQYLKKLNTSWSRGDVVTNYWNPALDILEALDKSLGAPDASHLFLEGTKDFRYMTFLDEISKRRDRSCFEAIVPILWKLRDQRSLEILDSLLHDADSRVRFNTVYALRRILHETHFSWDQFQTDEKGSLSHWEKRIKESIR